MRDLKISLCHHATTVVFVDDKKDYLMNLYGRFNELLPCLTFNTPYSALEYLNETYQEQPFIRRCTITPEDGTLNIFKSDVDIKTIQNEIYRPKRFSEISVVVVDYAMPKINGIEFCKLIKNPNILVILLTGEADYNIAIKAFNEGIIDKFIEKGTSNLGDVLYEEILKLEKKYFINLSNIIINQANPSNLQCLEDQDVVNLFYSFCKEHDISEYYILSERGDFLLLDKQANPIWITIKSQEEMESLCKYAENSDAPETVVQALRNREKLPVFYAARDTEPDTDDWDDYLCLAYPISKQYSYSYRLSTVDNSQVLDKILSYQAYLASV